MKKGDVVEIVPMTVGAGWFANRSVNGYYSPFHYYEHFINTTGIFLKELDEEYSLVLFGDKQIACITDDLSKL